MIFFQNILLTWEFLKWFGYISGYLPKWNKSLKLVSDAYSQRIFFYENFICEILVLEEKFSDDPLLASS